MMYAYSCVLGVGFGGIVEIKRGADEVVDALQDINSTMYRVRKQVICNVLLHLNLFLLLSLSIKNFT
jgi:hypothetical protein